MDGVSGVLINQAGGEGSPHYLIVWVKNGIVYGLSGNGDNSAGLALANSLQ